MTILAYKHSIYTIIKTTSVGDARLSALGVAGWPVILTGGRLAGDGGRGRSGRGRHTLRC